MEVNTERIDRLIQYVEKVMERQDGTLLYNKYKEDIKKVTPQEVFHIFYRLLKKSGDTKGILDILDKVIHVFNKSLTEYEWEKPKEGTFLHTMMKENQALEVKLVDIKEIIKRKDLKNNKDELLSRIEELKQFDAHYLKKENILFPYMEKKMEKFQGLSIMWALHDKARLSLKKLIKILNSKEPSETEFNGEIGNLFFILYGLIYKETHILFPSAVEVIDDKEWADMKKQSFEYDFPFIKRPFMDEDNMEQKEYEVVNEKEELVMKTETGELTFQQMVMILNALPVDLTYVDEKNRVKFFSKPKDRIFPRSPAAIGRNVENCHPPGSVHVVNNIIDEFKKGYKDSASFWIKFKGRMILIQYFALRDTQGKYKGVLEVSQDITEIKKIEGEKRLLEWK